MAAETMTKQLNEICELYHRSDLSKEEDRNALKEKIDHSGLPRYHKEILSVSFLTKRTESVSIGIQVIQQQEQLRHLDSLVKIQQKALAERLKKEGL